VSGTSRQRDLMRELFGRFAGDEARTVAGYAASERRGEVERRSNVRGIDPDEYARRLFADGRRRGWLS